jgi:serine/threonine protein kinase
MITQERVNICLEISEYDEKVGARKRSLGQVMVDRGYITRAQLKTITAENARRTGPQMIGPYEILSKIGEGGMGSVYKARMPNTGREVALKFLPRRLTNDPTIVTRFQREASVGLELDHPAIVPTYDVGDDRGLHFIALELMTGGDLQRWMSKKGRVPEKRAVEIVHDIAGALEHADDAGLVHRDVKPANIMFDSRGQPKLTDFGLVKLADKEVSHITRKGLAMGTPHYISPEQATGEADIDIRADIYSLGATLYHMVTGQYPFDADNPLLVISKHLNEELTPPDEINPELTDACVTLIENMMAKDPDDRYQTPAELLDDAELVLEGHEPTAEPLREGKSSVRLSLGRRDRLKASGRYKPRESDDEIGHQPRERPQSGSTKRAASRVPMVAALIAIALIVMIFVMITILRKPAKTPTEVLYPTPSGNIHGGSATDPAAPGGDGNKAAQPQ